MAVEPTKNDPRDGKAASGLDPLGRVNLALRNVAEHERRVAPCMVSYLLGALALLGGDAVTWTQVKCPMSSVRAA